MNSRQRRKARRIFRPLLKQVAKFLSRDQGRTPFMDFLAEHHPEEYKFRINESSKSRWKIRGGPVVTPGVPNSPD